LAGLEKTQVLPKKPAGRLNTGFSGQTGFFIENLLGAKSVKMQLQSMQPPRQRILVRFNNKNISNTLEDGG
jgi:hypothetical protein